MRCGAVALAIVSLLGAVGGATSPQPESATFAFWGEVLFVDLPLPALGIQAGTPFAGECRGSRARRGR